MMRDILAAQLRARNKQAETSAQGAQHMSYQQPREPGRDICKALKALEGEIEKLQPHNQPELSEAIYKLWLFKGCDRMSP